MHVNSGILVITRIIGCVSRNVIWIHDVAKPCVCELINLSLFEYFSLFAMRSYWNCLCQAEKAGETKEGKCHEACRNEGDGISFE